MRRPISRRCCKSRIEDLAWALGAYPGALEAARTRAAPKRRVFPMRVCEISYLGLTPYDEAHTLQRDLAERRKRDEIPDQFLLLEHPHVITLGRAANRANVLADDTVRTQFGVELFETGRGGDVTYHGPGQLVGYPIVKLLPGRQDIRRYVRDIQEVLVRAASDFGVEAEPRGGDFVGVWVGEEKLAAIGVRISRWVTMHGFAFNVTTDLNYFQLIVPCGIRGHGVTSLQKLLGRPVEMSEVTGSVKRHFGEVFNRELVAGDCRPVVGDHGSPAIEYQTPITKHQQA